MSPTANARRHFTSCWHCDGQWDFCLLVKKKKKKAWFTTYCNFCLKIRRDNLAPVSLDCISGWNTAFLSGISFKGLQPERGYRPPAANHHHENPQVARHRRGVFSKCQQCFVFFRRFAIKAAGNGRRMSAGVFKRGTAQQQDVPFQSAMKFFHDLTNERFFFLFFFLLGLCRWSHFRARLLAGKRSH